MGQQAVPDRAAVVGRQTVVNPVEADERLGIDVVIHVRDSRLAAFEVLGVGQGLVVSLHPVGLRSELGEQPFRRCWHVHGIALDCVQKSRRGAISARSLFGQPLVFLPSPVFFGDEFENPLPFHRWHQKRPPLLRLGRQRQRRIVRGPTDRRQLQPQQPDRRQQPN